MPRFASFIAETTPAGVEAELLTVIVPAVMSVLLEPAVKVRVISLLESIASSVAVKVVVDNVRCGNARVVTVTE